MGIVVSVKMTRFGHWCSRAIDITFVASARFSEWSACGGAVSGGPMGASGVGSAEVDELNSGAVDAPTRGGSLGPHAPSAT